MIGPRVRPPVQASDADRQSQPPQGARSADEGRVPPDPSMDRVRSVLEMVGTVIAPFTVITAWLYYSGWVRTTAIFSYFGIDQALLDLTSQDYLVRSAGVSFRPLLFLLLAWAAYLALGKGLTDVRRLRGRAARVLPGAVCATGVALVGLGLAGAFDVWPRPAPNKAALFLTIGALLVEVARTFSRPTRNGDLPRRTLIWLIAIAGAFWATALHAQTVGMNLARGWASDPDSRPAVTVHSATDLGLSGEGITREATGTEGAYRYSGLRLLIYSNKKWFLLPESRINGRPAAVIILSDDDKVRVEVRAPAGGP